MSAGLAAAITLGLLAPRLDDYAAIAARAGQPHLPNLALLAAQPLVIQVHILAAIASVGLGAIMMLSRKGRTFHRIAGWVWAALMMAIALSSLLISGGINGGRWSFLHLFAGWVFVFLPLAVLAARRHYVFGHRALMTMLFYGSLLVSGVLAFLPGRFMWQMFFG